MARTELRADRGPPLAVWRWSFGSTSESPRCVVDSAAFAGDRASFGVSALGERDTDPVEVTYDMRLHPAGVMATPLARFDVEDVSRFVRIGRLVASTELLVAHTSPPAWFFLVERDGSFVRRADGRDPGVLGIATTPVPVGRTLFFEDWADRVRVLRVDAEHTDSRPAISVQGADVRGLAASGERLVWLRAIGPYPDYERVEVWAADVHGTDATIGEHRKLSDVGRQSIGRAGGRWYAIATASNRAELVDVRTGEHRALDLPIGWELGDTVPWPLEDDAILMPVKPTGATRLTHVLRVPAGSFERVP